MKESIIYLKGKLSLLFEEHSYLEIRYEYKTTINSHIIEVKPVHCFNSDKKYIVKQIEIEKAFEDNFYGEEILFVTEDSLVKIVNPILSLGVTSINVDLSQFIKQKIVISTPKLCFDNSCYIISENNVFEVINDPPGDAIATNNKPQDSNILSESFLFLV